jgi:DNA-binding PadR family transcriptional regulator
MPIANDPQRFLPLTPVAFEILLVVAEGARHGYDVLQGIERRTGGRLSPNPGTLYRALDRLVREGLLETSEQATQSGGTRKVFQLSPLGGRVASAEAERLLDQVDAARSRQLLGRGGSG